jgi:hypothetical protein
MDFAFPYPRRLTRKTRGKDNSDFFLLYSMAPDVIELLRVQPEGESLMKAKLFLGWALVCSALAGCGFVRSGPSASERLDRELMAHRMMASMDITFVKFDYETVKTWAAQYYPGEEGANLARVLLDDGYWEKKSFAKTHCVKWEKPIIPHPSCQKDEIGIEPSNETREYISFIKSQARQIQQGRLTVEEADYRILAKGNEIKQRFTEEFAAAERTKQMRKQTPALERGQTIIINQPPPIPDYSQPQPQFSGPNPHELIMRCQGRAVDFVTGRCM